MGISLSQIYTQWEVADPKTEYKMLQRKVQLVPEPIIKSTKLLNHSKMLTASSRKTPNQLFPKILLKKSGTNTKILAAMLVLLSRHASSREFQTLILESVSMLVLIKLIPSSTNFSIKSFSIITDTIPKQSTFPI